jgi:hypothetical protein
MARDGAGGGNQSRRYYPCYVDTNDQTTLRFVVIIEPKMDVAKIEEIDKEFPQTKD